MTDHTSRHTVRLGGCTPRPLAGYLSGLGIFRLVAEQADPRARAAWVGGAFELTSTLDEDALLAFLRDEYQPTPVLSPWNGGSGFFPKDNTDSITVLEHSTGSRLAAYRAGIAVVRDVLDLLGLEAKPEKEAKANLIETLRAELPEASLHWLDAALALTAEGPRFPPLLGTGGNDGRLDFSNNFMARLVDVLGPLDSGSKGKKRLAHRTDWLRAAVLGEARPNLTKNAVGQFDPGGSGGANAGPGTSADSVVSPWRFVLMLEGALVFAASATRRLESTGPGVLVYPFSVRASTGGHASAVEGESQSGRDELWLPLWEQPASLPELLGLLREGRARVGKRTAETAVDFARAISRLGVTRGVEAFERYSFQERNGLAYQAVPLGTWPVRRNAGADLLDPLDRWLQTFRRATTAKEAPAALVRCRRAVDEAVLALCAEPEAPTRVQDLLRALGATARQQVRSWSYCTDRGDNLYRLPPIPWLGRAWLDKARSPDPAFRLAASLAARGLREAISPLDPARQVPTWTKPRPKTVRWVDGDLVRSLDAWLRRDQLAEERAEVPPWRVHLEDIAQWWTHPSLDRAVQDLAHGLMLVHPRHFPGRNGHVSAWLPPLFGVLHLTHDPREVVGRTLPRSPAILPRALAGDALGASRIALRRLRASGVPLKLHNGPRTVRPLDALPLANTDTRRLAAALAFPLSDAARAQLITSLVVPSSLTASP